MTALTSESRSTTAQAEGCRAADLAFSDLAEPKGIEGIDLQQFRRGQLAAIRHNLPVMMIATVIAVAAVVWIATGTAAATKLTVWGSAMLLAVACAWLAAVTTRDRAVTRRSVEKVGAWAVLFASLWALLPALCLYWERSSFCLLTMSMAMAAAGLGAYSLARIPSAALTFTAILTGAIAASSYLMGGELGVAMLVFTFAYGIALGVIIVGAHKAALVRAAEAAELERQGEIIKLLLKDFEAGASDWLWETGPTGELVYVSERLAHILGQDRDRLIGAKLHQAAGMPQSATGWRTLSVAMAKRQPVRDVEVSVRHKAKTTWWQISARALHDASGNFLGYRGVGTDITARREAAMEMVRAKQSAERASEAKSRFLATMSHELRTPLNAIVGFSEILAEEREGPLGHPNYAEYARNILEGSRHLTAVIGNVLDITRIEEGSAILVTQEIDPVELAEVVVKMCRKAARANDITMVQDFAIEPVDVSGDSTRLQQIMINLVDNALKFTPAGGVVRIALKRDGRGGLEFVVSDNGIGIAKQDLKRIFEPFVQAEDDSTRRFGGMGLGLAISRKLARLHGGDITIDSKPGKGTVARFVLPPSRLTPRPPAKAAAA